MLVWKDWVEVWTYNYGRGWGKVSEYFGRTGEVKVNGDVGFNLIE